jgi:hypothetical protein
VLLPLKEPNLELEGVGGDNFYSAKPWERESREGGDVKVASI